MDILFDATIRLFDRTGNLPKLPNAYLAELAMRQSRSTYEQSARHLKTFLEWCERNSVAFERATHENIWEYSRSLGEANTSYNRRIDRIADFYRFLERHHEVSNPMKRFVMQRRGKLTNALLRPRAKRKIIVCPKKHQIFTFIEHLKNPRDALIAWLMFDAGLRISEVRTLPRSILGLRMANGTVHLEVRGKGNKLRTVIVGERHWRALLQYARAGTGEYIFSADGGKTPLSSDAIQVAFRRAAALCSAELGGVKMNPHLLRHAFATFWLRAATKLSGNVKALDKNLKLLQMLLGHSDIETTQQYLHVIDAEESSETSRKINEKMNAEYEAWRAAKKVTHE